MLDFANIVNRLEEKEILSEYEGPLTSVLFDPTYPDNLYLCDWVDCDDKYNIWMITPTTEQIVAGLKANTVPKREALCEAGLCALAYQGSGVPVWADKIEVYYTSEKIIQDYLCAGDIYLNWCRPGGDDD